TKFDAEIRYDVTALKPENDYAIIGTDRIVDFDNKDLSISKDTSVIAEICGTVLLAKENTTPIFISDFTLENPYCDIETQNGSLTILGCAIDISRILMANDIEVSMYPNPTDEELKIVVKNRQTVIIKIELINNLGLIVSNIYNGSIESGEKTINFSPESYLPSGTYWIRIIIDGQEQIIKPILIIQ
ncbi:MAG: T9SS type A sorting domain-containing protein, partial [bacterium]